MREISRNFHTVENEQFTLKEKIFRQINCFVLSLFSEYVAFTDFWQKCVRVNFRNFHTLRDQMLRKFRNFTARIFPINSLKSTFY